MTTKAAIIVSVVTIVGALVVGLAVLLFSKPSSRGAEMLGQGLGVLALIPLFIVWILWADRFRKEREKRKKDR